MIKRIVKMSFHPDKTKDFIRIFNESKDLILASEGCYYVELLKFEEQPGIFFTLSLWEDQMSLEKYRKSKIFEDTWRRTKALFNGQPEAWSLFSESKNGSWK
jgi:quinol monooxygenase YgiN